MRPIANFTVSPAITDTRDTQVILTIHGSPPRHLLHGAMKTENVVKLKPAGKTPAATLYSALTRETKTKGHQARFHKTARGHFIYQTPQAS